MAFGLAGDDHRAAGIVEHVALKMELAIVAAPDKIGSSVIIEIIDGYDLPAVGDDLPRIDERRAVRQQNAPAAIDDVGPAIAVEVAGQPGPARRCGLRPDPVEVQRAAGTEPHIGTGKAVRIGKRVRTAITVEIAGDPAARPEAAGAPRRRRHIARARRVPDLWPAACRRGDQQFVDAVTVEIPGLDVVHLRAALKQIDAIETAVGILEDHRYPARVRQDQIAQSVAIDVPAGHCIAGEAGRDKLVG